MVQRLDSHREFEAIAQSFLAEQAHLRHEWKHIESPWSGGRTDLICEPGSPKEVWASLTKDQIAVGSGGEHKDFEGFGREISDAQLAAEAFDHFVGLLEAQGLVAHGSAHEG